MTTITHSDFVTRQTADSPHSHFEGSWLDMVRLTEAGFDKAVPGYRDGVVLVPVDPAGFFSATILLTEGTLLTGSYEARQPGEQPRQQIRAKGQKAPAKKVWIVLYRKDVLAENHENTPNSCPVCAGCPGECPACLGSRCADWEIVSVNASPTDEVELIAVYTLLHNHFHVPGSKDGGTSTGMSDSEFVAYLRKSFDYWKNKAKVAP